MVAVMKNMANNIYERINRMKYRWKTERRTNVSIIKESLKRREYRALDWSEYDFVKENYDKWW